MGTHQMHPKSKMWTLDCEDYVKNFKNFKNDSILERRRRRRRRRQFRHLMPILPSSSTSSKAGPPPPSLAISPSFSCSSAISNTTSGEKFSWKDHLMSKVENNISSEEAALVVSSRWNPTPEQLKALQEMYQRGVRTPSAEEIQLIAAKLRQFGRIEGKNVFYWFQNHKARERQKRRRQPDFSFLENIGTLQQDPKQTSLGWKDMDAEQNKKLVTTSNCILVPKGSASMHETAVTESRSNGWTHLDEKQQRQQQTCHRGTAAAKEDKIFWADQENRDEDSSRENRVLQLFPIIGGDDDLIPFRTTNNNKKNEIDEEELTSTFGAKITPNQFYEFL